MGALSLTRLYTLRTVDHNFPTANHNLSCLPFFRKKMFYFPSDMVLTVDRNLPFAPAVDIFHQKVDTYSRCSPSMCTRALPGFPILNQKFNY